VTARLGDLERKVMEILWTDFGTDVTVRHVEDRLPGYAYTTLLTVLDRLHKKDLVRRTKDGRAFRYTASTSREEYTARLMREALGAVADRAAVLARFAETVTPAEAAVLREVLESLGSPDARGRSDRQRRR
jgi:predicted transcriptional regulator